MRKILMVLLGLVFGGVIAGEVLQALLPYAPKYKKVQAQSRSFGDLTVTEPIETRTYRSGDTLKFSWTTTVSPGVYGRTVILAGNRKYSGFVELPDVYYLKPFDPVYDKDKRSVSVTVTNEIIQLLVHLFRSTTGGYPSVSPEDVKSNFFFEIRQEVLDGDGEPVSAIAVARSATVILEEVFPTNISISPIAAMTVQQGTEVTLSPSYSITPVQAGTVTYNWGDSSVEGNDPRHTYASAGTYTVTVTVTATDGTKAYVLTTVTVTAKPHSTRTVRVGDTLYLEVPLDGTRLYYTFKKYKKVKVPLTIELPYGVSAPKGYQEAVLQP